MLIAGNVEGPMLERLRNGRCPTWLLGLFSLAILSGSGISALGQDTDTASAKLAAAGVGGQYFYRVSGSLRLGKHPVKDR
jgi:hypothetical protein